MGRKVAGLKDRVNVTGSQTTEVGIVMWTDLFRAVCSSFFIAFYFHPLRKVSIRAQDYVSRPDFARELFHGVRE